MISADTQTYDPRTAAVRDRSRIPASKRNKPFPAGKARQLSFRDFFEGLPEAAAVNEPRDVFSRVFYFSENLKGSSKIEQRDIWQAVHRLEIPALQVLREDVSTIFTVDLRRNCGEQRVVPTTRQDECFWAPAISSEGRCHQTADGLVQYRRYVQGRVAEPTSLVTLVVVRTEPHRFLLATAYYGAASMKVPGTLGATAEDGRWWYDAETQCGHAFIFNGQTDVVVNQRVYQNPWR